MPSTLPPPHGMMQTPLGWDQAALFTWRTVVDQRQLPKGSPGTSFEKRMRRTAVGSVASGTWARQEALCKCVQTLVRQSSLTLGNGGGDPAAIFSRCQGLWTRASRVTNCSWALCSVPTFVISKHELGATPSWSAFPLSPIQLYKSRVEPLRVSLEAKLQLADILANHRSKQAIPCECHSHRLQGHAPIEGERKWTHLTCDTCHGQAPTACLGVEAALHVCVCNSNCSFVCRIH